MDRKLVALAALVVCAVLNGCGSGGTQASPEPTPAPAPGAAALTLSAASLSFGSVTVGQTGAAQTLTLTDSGGSALTLNSVTLSDTADYSLTDDCGTTVAVAASCGVSVTFKPQTAVSLPGTLTIGDSAGNSPQTVALSGTGTAVPLPVLTLSSSALAFGAVTLGQVSAAQSLTLSNTGSAVLNLSGVTVSDTADYAVTDGCGATLAAGANCAVSVVFQPQSVAALPATLTIADNASGSPQSVALSGSGSAVPVAALSITPGALVFASTSVGQTSAGQLVTLTDTGTAALSLSGITLSDTADYALVNGCGTSLAAGASCGFTVSFHPQTVGALTGIIAIADNAAGSPQSVGLSGTGAAAPAPVAVVSPGVLTFGAGTVGTASAAQNLVVSNTGNAALTIASIAATGAGFAESNNCAGTVAAGGSCSVAVTFTAAAASTAYSGALVITDNSGNSAGSVQMVSLSGSGAAPAPAAQAVVSPGSLTFAGTPVGTASAGEMVTLANPGNAALTGITVTLGGANAAAFSESSTCGATLAAGANCGITVVFAPAAVGSFSAMLSVADSVTGSPQTVALNGTGTAPQAALSPGSLTFAATPTGTMASAMSAMLTNAGTAPLTITGIVLGGANASAFAESTTCGATLAAGASCSIAVTFTPAAVQSYSATVTVTDNAGGSPQVLMLSGTGAAPAITRTLLVEPDDGFASLYAMVNGAQKTIDMTMYELVDTTFSGDLVAACKRGVRVRVILDQNLEKSSNTPAYNQLNGAGANCSAVFANPVYQATHQKSFIVDGTQVAIMTLNLTSRYYTTTRDFAVVENDAVDIAAIQATFNEDYVDATYSPTNGDDLIWSPTNATSALLGIINGATTTLLVENEEMSAPNIVSALEADCKRGVTVDIAMTDTGSYHSEFSALQAAGCGVHTYPDTATALYIHAKAMVADYGLSTQAVYVGSINFSTASLTENRELGLYVSDPAIVARLETTIVNDYAGAAPY